MKPGLGSPAEGALNPELLSAPGGLRPDVFKGCLRPEVVRGCLRPELDGMAWAGRAAWFCWEGARGFLNGAEEGVDAGRPEEGVEVGRLEVGRIAAFT